MTRTLEPRHHNDGMAGTDEDYQAWIKTRPASTQALITEFPMGAVVTLPERNDAGGDYYIIGWGEGDSVSISPIWLGDDYEESIARRLRIHAEHIRDGEVTIKQFKPCLSNCHTQELNDE